MKEINESLKNKNLTQKDYYIKSFSVLKEIFSKDKKYLPSIIALFALSGYTMYNSFVIAVKAAAAKDSFPKFPLFDILMNILIVIVIEYALNLFQNNVISRIDKKNELTKENIKKNNGKDDFEVRKSFVFENISENFDIILSNPPIRAGKQVIFQIYEESFSHLNKDGKFYCVIQTKHGAKSTQKELHKLFGNCTTLAIESGYRIFKCVNKK